MSENELETKLAKFLAQDKQVQQMLHGSDFNGNWILFYVFIKKDFFICEETIASG